MYDPDKARALLKTAGYPDGFSISFKAPDGRYLQDKQVAEAIVGQLDKVGIKAELETVDWSTYVQGIVGRKYELFLLSQGGLQVGPAVQTNWSSKIKGIAWQGYTNPAVDEMIDTAAQQVDAAKRKATYEQLHEDRLGRVAVDLPVPPARHLRRVRPGQELPPDVRGRVRLGETTVS
jgi:peptide/nickel transport system substrate-binding protein